MRSASPSKVVTRPAEQHPGALGELALEHDALGLVRHDQHRVVPASRRREELPYDQPELAAPSRPYDQPERHASVLRPVSAAAAMPVHLRLDELVHLRDAVAVGVVDLDERLPLVGHRVLGEDRLDRALGLAGAAVDALLGVDDQHPVGLVDAVDGADVDAGLVLHVDAGLGDDVCHLGVAPELEGS